MLENPIEYKSDAERLQAGHIRNKVMATINQNLEEIIRVHRKVSDFDRPLQLSPSERDGLDIVLNTVVSEAFHRDAEQTFLLKTLGVDDAKTDEQG